MSEQPVVHIVDDDGMTRSRLTELVKSVGLSSREYANGQEFLEACHPQERGCVVLDLLLRGDDGLNLQLDLIKRQSVMPILVITAFADIPIAVQAMKNGAFDFMQKPLNDDAFIKAIREAIAVDKKRWNVMGRHYEVKQRIDLLTRRENEVLEAICSGDANKMIADKLNISQKTVEFHRANLMKKMQARSVAELVRQVVLHDVFTKTVSPRMGI